MPRKLSKPKYSATVSAILQVTKATASAQHTDDSDEL